MANDKEVLTPLERAQKAIKPRKWYQRIKLPGWKGDPYAIGISLISLCASLATFGLANLYHVADIALISNEAPIPLMVDSEKRTVDTLQPLTLTFVNNGTVPVAVQSVMEVITARPRFEPCTKVYDGFSVLYIQPDDKFKPFVVNQNDIKVRNLIFKSHFDAPKNAYGEEVLGTFGRTRDLCVDLVVAFVVSSAGSLNAVKPMGKYTKLTYASDGKLDFVAEQETSPDWKSFYTKAELYTTLYHKKWLLSW